MWIKYSALQTALKLSEKESKEIMLRITKVLEKKDKNMPGPGTGG